MRKQTLKTWKMLRQEVRQYLKMTPLSDEKIQAEFEAAGDISLSEDEIETIVNSVTSGESRLTYLQTDDVEWMKDIETQQIQKDVFALNRNEGVEDPEVQERLEKHRKQALESEINSDDNDTKKSNRMEKDKSEGE